MLLIRALRQIIMCIVQVLFLSFGGNILNIHAAQFLCWLLTSDLTSHLWPLTMNLWAARVVSIYPVTN